MHWWTITNLRSGYSYGSDDTPLTLVDCVKEVSIPLGHTLMHMDVLVECGPIKVDFRTGGIWQSGRPVEVVENPDKLILFKRKVRDGKTGRSLGERIFIGIISRTGTGLMMRQEGKHGWKLESFCIGVPVSE